MGVKHTVTGKITRIVALPQATTAPRECRKGKHYRRKPNVKLLSDTLNVISVVSVYNKSTLIFYLHFSNWSHAQMSLTLFQASYSAAWVGGTPLPDEGIRESPAPSSAVTSISTFLFLSAQYLLHPSVSSVSAARERSLLWITVRVYGFIFLAPFPT